MLLSLTRPAKLWVINLRNIRSYHIAKKKIIKDEHYIAKHIFQKIKAKGPITVAEYMKQVLTNTVAGYYMRKDMFGETGDFVTSPEITQMFGEMIAVWFLNEWQKMGSPKPFQIVELGPGRGTLSNDILKVFNHFKSLHKASLHLIEISPTLSDIQAELLCRANFCDENAAAYKKGISHNGVPVHWYKRLNDVPNNFTLFIAHEFFDALPIHKFHRKYNGYKEVLIDVDISNPKSNEHKFKYVLARNHTPMSKVLIKPNESREHVETSPDSILIYKEICERIKLSGGIALICDYGHDGSGTDTFRAFKDHKQVDPLEMPGSADLTADVDFSLIREAANEVGGIISLGPTTQKNFLLKTGLEYRFKSLAQNIKNKKQLENLKECFKFLTDEDKMGERFKFCALFPETVKKILDRYPVIGFS
ncbi:hypothetical protein NQ318_001979 [Aromia moschata]|uniref:Protein arginine methyltransferase NDUFAF7 n=1 Tax=Aromia moschata TaxID=1265417 RepID=A0AAV8Z3Q7_9CUCU|nr:hypothetical protein NQ318_001979 [Aromia moschata]